MIRVEAGTLQEAYSKAAAELSCSVVDLEINIIQNGSSGFLGLFKKNAIVEVGRKGARANRQEEMQSKQEPVSKNPIKESDDGEKETTEEFRKSKRNKNRRSKNKKRDGAKDEVADKKVEQAPVREREIVAPKEHKIANATTAPQPKEPRLAIAPTQIDQNFHQEKRDISEVVDEVRVNIKNLFKHSCFTLDAPIVSKYNDDTILIEFCGEDAALLIGKEGYRYKALSYLLYNWINIKYGFNIRLEIAEFLKNQEEMIDKYLLPIIERIKTTGKGQTKILDGVLIKIALEVLRTEFPEKYVGIKLGREGGKFIVVNDFNRRTS